MNWSCRVESAGSARARVCACMRGLREAATETDVFINIPASPSEVLLSRKCGMQSGAVKTSAHLKQRHLGGCCNLFQSFQIRSILQVWLCILKMKRARAHTRTGMFVDSLKVTFKVDEKHSGGRRRHTFLPLWNREQRPITTC